MAEIDTDRRDSLIRDAVDECLSPESRAEFLDLLRADAEARRLYVQQSIVDAGLAELLGRESLAGALDAAPESRPSASASDTSPTSSRPSRTRWLMSLVLLTSLLAIVAAGIALLSDKPDFDTSESTAGDREKPPSGAASRASRRSDTAVPNEQSAVPVPGQTVTPSRSTSDTTSTDFAAVEPDGPAPETGGLASALRRAFEFLTLHPSVIQQARESARRAYSINNLKAIGVGLHRYHAAYDGFPAAYSVDAAGRPLLSWRVHLLPFLKHGELYTRFHLNEPWDSEHNRTLIAEVPAVFRTAEADARRGLTNYLAIRSSNGILCPPSPAARSMLIPRGIRLSEVRDGTALTITAVEVHDRHAVIWTRPEDCELSDPPQLLQLAHQRNGQLILALFADGSVHALPSDIDPAVFSHLTTRSGGESVIVP